MRMTKPHSKAARVNLERLQQKQMEEYREEQEQTIKRGIEQIYEGIQDIRFKGMAYNRTAYLVDTYGPRLWGSR